MERCPSSCWLLFRRRAARSGCVVGLRSYYEGLSAENPFYPTDLFVNEVHRLGLIIRLEENRGIILSERCPRSYDLHCLGWSLGNILQRLGELAEPAAGAAYPNQCQVVRHSMKVHKNIYLKS